MGMQMTPGSTPDTRFLQVLDRLAKGHYEGKPAIIIYEDGQINVEVHETTPVAMFDMMLTAITALTKIMRLSNEARICFAFEYASALRYRLLEEIDIASSKYMREIFRDAFDDLTCVVHNEYPSQEDGLAFAEEQAQLFIDMVRDAYTLNDEREPEE